MLKTSSTKSVKLRKGGVRVNGNIKAGRGGNNIDDRREIDSSKLDDSKVEDDKVKKKVQKTAKSKKIVETDFLTPRAKLAFTKLRQAFFKALILYYFDSKCHIRIGMDVSGYAMSGVFSQLSLDNLGQWYLVAFFLQNMIPVETRYETHDSELLAILEAFKT